MRFYLILILCLFIHPLFALQYKDVFSGNFHPNEQTDFVYFYQSDSQVGTPFVTLEIKDIYLDSAAPNPNYTFCLNDVNGDGLDDLFFLPDDLGEGDVFGDRKVYYGGIRIRLSEKITVSSPDGVHYTARYHKLPPNGIDIPLSFPISNFDRLFSGDFDQNGKDNFFMAGWQTQGTKVYYVLTEPTFHNYNSVSSTPVALGVIQFYSFVNDLFFFKDRVVPSCYYLLVQSDSLASIYVYDKNRETFNKLKSIPTDQTIHKIFPLDSSHSLLSDYNLLLHVGDTVSLKNFSSHGSFEKSQALFIENQDIYKDNGYIFHTIYSTENNHEGRFSIWWEDSSGSGKLLFYQITQEDDGSFQLSEETVDGFSSVSYDQQPFRVVYRPSSSIDNGEWLVIRANQEDLDHYVY